MRESNTTSQSMEENSKYRCQKCNDSNWISNEDGTYKRCECYGIEYAERLWNNFGVRPDEVKKINEYKSYDELTTNAKDKAIEYIHKFDDIRGTRENSIGLFGQAGAGKSHLIIAVGAALLNREKSPISVIYMPYLEVMRELKANTLDDEVYLRISSKYQRAQVLIIDDLFKDKVKNGQLIKFGNQYIGLTEADMKHIYPILNYRYINHLPTLVSTECTPKMLLDLDEALAGRILEVCGDNMVVFQGPQYNFRMRKFVK